MTEAARKLATYDDVLAAPAHTIAQLVDGELIVQPRPAAGHQVASSRVGADLDGPFDRGRGGPGGWWILDEPELHLRGNVLVPDLAGWRRERMPTIANVPYFELAPDWVCEVLSPSTEAFDRGQKLSLYASAGVSRAWLVNTELHMVEVFELRGGVYALVQTAVDQSELRAVPFDAVALPMAEWWLDRA